YVRTARRPVTGPASYWKSPKTRSCATSSSCMTSPTGCGSAGSPSRSTISAICQAAIDLAHRFGSAAVAEGIESPTDLQALQVMGCDFGQGVLIAPPMPQERFLG